jgi:Ca2+-binding RTX toxin-like protein
MPTYLPRKWLARAGALAVVPVLALAGTALADQVLTGTDANDAITGTPGADTIFALGGNDAVNAAAGNDDVDGGTGADDIRGGSGSDAVMYGNRAGAVSVSLDEVANDGEAGEGDNVHSDVENVYGGAGGDRLTGNGKANLLDGAGGDDVIFGGTGADRIYGGDGADVITSFDGTKDVVDCGPGSDTVTADRIELLIACERRIPPPRVHSPVDFDLTFQGSRTHVDKLVVRRIPRNGSVEVRCRGGGCPFATNRTRLRSGENRVALTGLFRGHDLRAGATVEVRVTAPGAIGKVARFRMRRNAAPHVSQLCLLPGSTTPRKRC